MPHTHQPDPTNRTAITRTCPACGRDRMRLKVARPSLHFTNLDECIYRCDCGEEAEYMMMRPEPE
jgi:hypothetical protein